MIAIIDYDAGNLKSVEKAIQKIGGSPLITRDPAKIAAADHVILPGVGSFGDAMNQIRRFELEETIRQVTRTGTPFLGICLGLQLLFGRSEESPGAEGLSILEGTIRRIPDAPGLKIPHMGWNSLHFEHPGRLFAGLPEQMYVYFVHSYYLQAEDPAIVSATAEYGVTVHAAVEKENVFACQFHPEKSGEAGLKILENFLAVK